MSNELNICLSYALQKNSLPQLHLAIQDRNKALIAQLIENGADVNTRSNDVRNTSPLKNASYIKIFDN